MIVASFYAPRYEKWPGCDYDELLLLVDKSCKKLGLNHIVISDSFRPKPLNTFVTRLPENLIQAILYGQWKFLQESQEPILLIGADCLLTKLIPEFEEDIGITLGPFSDCKMNTGMVYVKDGKKSEQVWAAALELNPTVWGQDQTFLYESILESGLDIKELRCEEYNWAPNNIHDDAGLPYVVHFRGKRKSFMKNWAKTYLEIE